MNKYKKIFNKLKKLKKLKKHAHLNTKKILLKQFSIIPKNTKSCQLNWTTVVIFLLNYVL